VLKAYTVISADTLATCEWWWWRWTSEIILHWPYRKARRSVNATLRDAVVAFGKPIGDCSPAGRPPGPRFSTATHTWARLSPRAWHG